MMKTNHSKNHQTFWIIIVILATIISSILAIYFSSKTTKTEPEIKAKLVRTLKAKKSNQRIIVTAYGTVQADREVTLRSEVSGRVIEQSPNLVLGGIVKEGEILLKLDDQDYSIIVEQEKAAVEKAKFELQLEHGRQIVAKREWEQLSPTIKTTELSEELALRKPHMREKEAAFVAALSRLEKATLDLQRTVIKSPLNATVTTETVEVGDYITPQTEIAKIVATDKFRIQVSVPVSKLKWIRMPTNNNSGSPVKLILDIGGKPVVRNGKIQRLLSNLDPSGRMARILIEVEDPLGLKSSNNQQLPLLIGTYTKVEFEGPTLEDVFVLPRVALQENNKVWVKSDDNTLEIRDVNVVDKRDQLVSIDSGLNEGDNIVITSLSLAIPGMKLKTLEESNEDNKERP